MMDGHPRLGVIGVIGCTSYDGLMLQMYPQRGECPHDRYSCPLLYGALVNGGDIALFSFSALASQLVVS
jgi:hypothetical protein